ncbi:MAG: CotH kinase family protein [Firmicutes bacterium]|nr:CotH kinase family protein [Bacillota bacterium]
MKKKLLASLLILVVAFSLVACLANDNGSGDNGYQNGSTENGGTGGSGSDKDNDSGSGSGSSDNDNDSGSGSDKDSDGGYDNKGDDNNNDNDDAWNPASRYKHFNAFASLHIDVPNNITTNPNASRENGHLDFVTRDWQGGISFSVKGAHEGHNFEGALGQIRGRGNSSWWQGERYGKKPFRIRFAQARDMLGVGNGNVYRDWLFIANYQDLSLLRNYSAYFLGGLLEYQAWTTKARHMHVYVNGNYMGIYMLAEHREVAPGRVQAQFNADPTLSEYYIELNTRAHDNRATNGYIEWEDYILVNPRNTRGEPQQNTNGSLRMRAYEIRYPSGSRLTRAHKEYARDFLQNVHDVIATRDWDAINNVIDVGSFIDFYIVQEWYKNFDVFGASVFMNIAAPRVATHGAAGNSVQRTASSAEALQRSGNSGQHSAGSAEAGNKRLVLGHIWDFDVAAGNKDRVADYCVFIGGSCVRQSATSYRGLWATHHVWFRDLIRVPQFVDLLNQRWSEVKDSHLEHTLQLIEYLSTTYKQDFERNFKRWDILGTQMWAVPSSIQQIDTFSGQVEFLLNFLRNRREWLSTEFSELRV